MTRIIETRGETIGDGGTTATMSTVGTPCVKPIRAHMIDMDRARDQLGNAERHTRSTKTGRRLGAGRETPRLFV